LLGCGRQPALDYYRRKSARDAKIVGSRVPFVPSSRPGRGARHLSRRNGRASYRRPPLDTGPEETGPTRGERGRFSQLGCGREPALSPSKGERNALFNRRLGDAPDRAQATCVLTDSSVPSFMDNIADRNPLAGSRSHPR